MASYDDTATVSGSVVGFSNGADSVPLKNWLVTLPASLDGYTEVNGVRTGKNLLNVNAITNTTNPNNATIVNNGNGTITVTTTTQQNVKTAQKLKDICPNVKIGETYFLNATTTGTQKIIYLHQAAVSWTYGTAKAITSQMLESDVSLYASGTNSTATISDLSLTYGSTATAYEPYEAPTTYTASLGRTIYGGTADIVTGEGSADGAIVTLDDTMSYGINLGTDTNRIAVSFYNSVGKINGTFASNVLTVGENTSGGYKTEPWVIWGSTSAARMWISVPTSIDTVDKFKQYLQNNTITIAYELATPTDFTFTPITPTPETAKGSNTFWSDQGNTEVTYYKDGYGFTSVTIHKETPEGEPVEQTAKLHKIVYGGLVDVISGKAEPKNLLKVTGEKTTYADITYTVNDKGQVMANGTATALRSFKVIKNGDPGFSFKKGVTYTLSGCPSGGSDQTYQLDLRNTNTVGTFFMNAKDYGNGVTFTPTEDAVAFPIILVRNGQVCDNLTFNPQIEISGSKTEYAPHFDPFTFPPISMETDEGENTLYADEGDSAIVYRKAVE